MTSPFCQNLDYIWESLGYASKRNALRRLKKSFKAGIDYKATREVKIASNGKRVHYDHVLLTYDCYFRFRAIAPVSTPISDAPKRAAHRATNKFRAHLRGTTLF
jgi:hypothetical protein